MAKNKFDDARELTYRSRVDIGFKNEYQRWQSSKADFSEHSLVINGHPVMEDWEREYMRELALIASSRAGTVLELGFGMGLSAGFIQEQKIEEHIIVEANEDVFKKLIQFSTNSKRPVRPMRGFWQQATAELPDKSISGILFDTYPLDANEVHRNHFDFFEEAYRLLRPGGVLTYYSDEIKDFSPDHLGALRGAGFSKIDKKICEVTPPKDCQYWKSNTILAPIVSK